MASDMRFVIQFLMTSGATIEQHLTEAAADDVIASRTFIWPASMSEDDKRPAAIFTVLAQRIDKGSGFVSVTDPDGRTWLLRPETIYTFNLLDRKNRAGLRTLGFASPIVETS